MGIDYPVPPRHRRTPNDCVDQLSGADTLLAAEERDEKRELKPSELDAPSINPRLLLVEPELEIGRPNTR
jgi:hypothetical protein